jgi:hypothetical protein
VNCRAASSCTRIRGARQNPALAAVESGFSAENEKREDVLPLTLREGLVAGAFVAWSLLVGTSVEGLVGKIKVPPLFRLKEKATATTIAVNKSSANLRNTVAP